VAPDLAERDPAFGRTVCTNLRNRSGWVGLQVTGFVEIGTHRFGMNIFYGGENVTVSAKSQNETRFLLALIQSRRLSEEALGHARAALTHMARLTTLGMLAPSIAHEVTQPLAGIVTNANTCLRALTTDPPNLDGARAAARRALRDVERAHDLITRLRMLVVKKEVTCESLDLNDAIRETVALLSSELQKHRVAEELANRLRTSCWSCTRSPLTRGRSPANSVAAAKASNTFA
jgi:signal transduction histidine kinase